MATWIRRYARDESGVMAILAVIFVIMLLGVGGLVMDLGRVYNLHSQMSSYADSAALAAAAELDGNAGALTRAMRAAMGSGGVGPLVKGVGSSGSNSAATPATFGSAPAAFAVESLYFFSAISTDPADPNADQRNIAGDQPFKLCQYDSGGFSSPCNGSGGLATADSKAQFVVVTVKPQTVSYFILPFIDMIGGLFGATPVVKSQTTQLQATAGFKREVCNNVPIMICNPNEATQGSGADFTPVRGQQIIAKMQGGAGAWGPGNFGLLDAYSGNGASAIRDAIARRDPNTICVSSKVNTKPGQTTGPVQDGMNVRFDMYNGNMSGNRTDAEYAPSANVTKGLSTNNGNCKNSKSNSSMPMPRDNCFMGGTNGGTGCTYYNSEKRWGDGSWDRNAYWSQNHPGVAQPAGYSTMSRYDVYRYEIDHPQPVNTADENSGPVCQSPGIADAKNDRRVLIVAVVNCLSYNVQGNDSNVPVKAFAKVFLTEPVGNTAWESKTMNGVTWGSISNQDVAIEMIGKVDANAPDGVLHEYPVLYR